MPYSSIESYIAHGCPAIADSYTSESEQKALVDALRPYRLRPLTDDYRIALDERGHISSVCDATAEGAAELIDSDTGPCEVVDVRCLT